MYAVIESGGKQYRVELGSEIEVDRLDVEPGADHRPSTGCCSSPMARTAAIGRPVVDGAIVSADVAAPGARREDRRVQVQAQGAHARQEGPPRGADHPAHRRHRVRRPERRQGGPAKAEPQEQAGARAPRRQPTSRPPPTRRSPRSWQPTGADRDATPKRTRASTRRPTAARSRRRPTPRTRHRGRQRGDRGRRAEAADGARAGRQPTPMRRRRHRRRRRPTRPTTPSRPPRADAEADADDAADRRRSPGRTSNPMAHKKAGSSSKNGRDSVGQRLGVKAGDGQLVQRRLDHRAPARHDLPGRARAPGSGATTRSSRPSPAASASSTSGATRSASASMADAAPPAAATGEHRRHAVKTDIHPRVPPGARHLRAPATRRSPSAPRSTELRVDICSNCHPFYTGKQTIVDTAGQVERFQKRLERSARL